MPESLIKIQTKFLMESAELMVGIFCKQIEELRLKDYATKFSDLKYDVKEFDGDCKYLRQVIDELYKSDNEDIEDFSDLIMIFNDICFAVIKNLAFNTDQLKVISRIRIEAKKAVKQKYRDFKYKGRQFWNYQEANQQYYELVTYVWEPSVEKYLSLVSEYRSPQLKSHNVTLSK